MRACDSWRKRPKQTRGGEGDQESSPGRSDPVCVLNLESGDIVVWAAQHASSITASRRLRTGSAR
jgi:hypothetical protein